METNRSVSNTPPTPTIGFIDVDSFECQLYQRDYPAYWGKPCAVVNAGGRVVAASHEAKRLGISRTDTPTLRDIKKKFSHVPVKIFFKENRWGKQDSTKTRHATWELLDAVQKFVRRYGSDITIELDASDELYLDITTMVTESIRKSTIPNVYISDRVVWERRKSSVRGPFPFYAPNKKYLESQGRYYAYRMKKEEERLIHGAKFMDSLIQYIFQQTQLQCSGGVAKNKLLAKVGCGVNKPSKITIMEIEGFQRLSSSLKISDIPGLRGQAGQKLKNQMGCETLLDLKKLSIFKLRNVFDDESSQRFLNYARGIDNSPVIHRIMKTDIRCKKPSQDIRNFKQLKLTLANLKNEMRFILKEEASRHKRKPNEIRIDMTFLTQQNGDQEKYTFSAKEVSSLYDKMMDEIARLEDRQMKDFRVTELAIVSTNFVITEGNLTMLQNTRLAPKGLTYMHILNHQNPQIPSTELRVKVKGLNTVPNFSNRVRIGEFRTYYTSRESYSTVDVELPTLRPLAEIKKYVGKNLGEGFELKNLIKDHTGYNEFKHKCFIQFLKEKNILGNNNERKPNFIGFGGRFQDTLQTVCQDNYGKWSFYAVNVNNVIWIWEEKAPTRSDIFSYFGAYFEKLVTRPPNGQSKWGENLHDGDMVYHVDQVDFGKHRILLVNQVDSIKEDGKMIEITQLAQCMTFSKSLRLWSQLTVQGVENILVGIRDKHTNILQAVDEIEIGELINKEVGKENVLQCLNFQSRLLDFVQSHLSESNPKKVKRFSWINGSTKITSENIPELNLNTLVFHRLYFDFLRF